MYATLEDIEKRCRHTLSDSEKTICETLLEDSAIQIDSYNKNASDEAKKVVTCRMILRVIGSEENYQVPIGTSQGTISALGYSQTWTMGSGSTGELYLSKEDKKILGYGNKAGFINILEETS